MKIAWLIMTDGRKDYIHQTIASGSSMLKGPITERWLHDDSGDEGNRQWLQEQFPAFTHIGQGPRRGFGGAYSFAWKTLAAQSEADFIFNLEDDFTFNREIPLEAMAKVLEENPHIYQMALRRQAWNSEEIKAGGVIERWPEEFHQENGWISHRLFFTTNPSLYRRSLIETRTYPDVKDSEGHFSISIVDSDPIAVFGYWGQKTDAPWVTHIGAQRQPGGSY
jgi:glycosyl transferase family 2